LKFEKDGHLTKRASKAPKSIAAKNQKNWRKVGREKPKNAPHLAPEVSTREQILFCLSWRKPPF
jgi:hypothetical protein